MANNETKKAWMLEKDKTINSYFLVIDYKLTYKTKFNLQQNYPPNVISFSIKTWAFH